MKFRWIEMCPCGTPYVWMHQLPEDWEAWMKKQGYGGITYSIRVEVKGVQPGDERFDPARHTMHYPKCSINPELRQKPKKKP